MKKISGFLRKICSWCLILGMVLSVGGCAKAQDLCKEICGKAKSVFSDSSTFSIRFLDVGQADAALIECDGHYMLIDGGNRDDSGKMYSILKALNIDHLDIVVGTHADEDHIGGLAGALNYATADVTLCPTTVYDTETFMDFAKYAEQNGGGITVPEIGDTYSLGSSQVIILGVNGGSDSNDTSIILKIIYEDTSFLFTGDAEMEAEQAVIDSGSDLSATVLKVAHHGSADSTGEEFLTKVMPDYAVISVGDQNTYLHPAEETLEKLKNVHAEIYRTDQQGEIIVVSDGKNVNITTEKDAQDYVIPGTRFHQNTEPDTGINDYVLNTNSKKFHYPFCESVSKMKEKNTDYYTGTRDEVIAMEYEPCGNCQP